MGLRSLIRSIGIRIYVRRNRRSLLEMHSWLNRYMSVCFVLFGIFFFASITSSATIQHGSEDVLPEEFVPTRDKPFDVLMLEANFIMNRDIDSAKRIGDPDHDFVSLILPYHEGAINLARVLLVYGTDKEIRELAQGIITRQQHEIIYMLDWLKHHKPKESAEGGGKKKTPFNDLVDEAMVRMHKDLQEVFRLIRSEDYDHEFVNVMIPQRKGTVDMARALLTYGKDQEILDLAKKISKEQQSEIQSMQKWLKKHEKELPH